MQKPQNVQLIEHRGRIWISVKKMTAPVLSGIRKIPGVYYSVTHRSWLVPDTSENRNICRQLFATHLLDKGTDISMIQKLLGHNDIRTTLRYLHTSHKDLLGVVSPIDHLNLVMPKSLPGRND